MDELTIGDKIYISSKRAAQITGYAKDYVGQLCREGHVEAKMVGRSWYVLESSIRTHRFGAPEAPEKESEVIEPTEEKSVPQSWESSVYISEQVSELPSLSETRYQIEVTEKTKQTVAMSDTQDSLNEMQEAWKEWFAGRQEKAEEVPEAVQEEVVEELEEQPVEEVVEEEVSVAVHRIPTVRPNVSPRPIDMVIPTPQPVRKAPVAISTPIYRNEHIVAPKERTNVVTAVLLVLLAVVIALIAVVGSGFADTYIKDNAVIEFLGGTSSVKK